MLWIPKISRDLYVGYFGWCTDETFDRIRLLVVVLSGLLRLSLLPNCIQEQCDPSCLYFTFGFLWCRGRKVVTSRVCASDPHRVQMLSLCNDGLRADASTGLHPRPGETTATHSLCAVLHHCAYPPGALSAPALLLFYCVCAILV